MFSLICVWINGLVNNREAGDLRRYRTHYDVTVMSPCDFSGHLLPGRLVNIGLGIKWLPDGTITRTNIHSRIVGLILWSQLRWNLITKTYFFDKIIVRKFWPLVCRPEELYYSNLNRLWETPFVILAFQCNHSPLSSINIWIFNYIPYNPPVMCHSNMFVEIATLLCVHTKNTNRVLPRSNLGQMWQENLEL